MSDPLFDCYGNQTRALHVTGGGTDTTRIERLLFVIARKLGADLGGFDVCACSHERDEHVVWSDGTRHCRGFCCDCEGFAPAG